MVSVILTVSSSFVFIFGGVGTVSSRRAGAHTEDVPGRWFQTWDDHTGSLGARWRVAQLLMFLWERAIQHQKNDLAGEDQLYLHAPELIIQTTVSTHADILADYNPVSTVLCICQQW